MEDKDSVHIPTECVMARPTAEGDKLTITILKNGASAKGLEFELYSETERQHERRQAPRNTDRETR